MFDVLRPVYERIWSSIAFSSVARRSYSSTETAADGSGGVDDVFTGCSLFQYINRSESVAVTLPAEFQQVYERGVLATFVVDTLGTQCRPESITKQPEADAELPEEWIVGGAALSFFLFFFFSFL